jgi:hypothetical protein
VSHSIILPPGSLELGRTVFTPEVMVFVKGGEGHSALVSETVTDAIVVHCYFIEMHFWECGNDTQDFVTLIKGWLINVCSLGFLWVAGILVNFVKHNLIFVRPGNRLVRFWSTFF